MKFELKNKRTQELLDELTDGQFSKELQIATPASTQWVTVTAGLGDQGTLKVFIFREHVSQKAGFEPNKWNSYPYIKPPMEIWNTWMMCETMNNSVRGTTRHVARFDGEKWLSTNNKEVTVHRYKPWG